MTRISCSSLRGYEMSGRTLTCGRCAYDMTDQPRGALCPECGTPLDTRKDDPIGDRYSTLAIGFLATAILLMPFVGSLSILFVVISQFQVTKRHSLVNEYRVSMKTMRNRQIVRILLFVWAVEIAFMLSVTIYYPDAFNW